MVFHWCFSEFGISLNHKGVLMDFNFIEMMSFLGIVTICGLLLRIIHLMEKNETKEIKEQGKKIEKQYVWGMFIFVFLFVILSKCSG